MQARAMSTFVDRSTPRAGVEPASLVPPSQVYSALNELEAHALGLEDAVTRLEERIGTVLMACPPDVCDGHEVRPLVPLAEQLERIDDRYVFAIDRLNRIIDRVQL